ncbi:phospholipid transfer protein [Stylonychia lemnae]|uniref:Phospholipid transfer protein n=1 Tax=Stylonychia lemnae TaxID=5949 RepID=A0A078A8J3_STYLE|nr:phospholipid transfer protein [Stylonychia lemnae]|eukprot:CDW78196.1 phospholipid transfer protein [Stylonychia lemnae]
MTIVNSKILGVCALILINNMITAQSKKNINLEQAPTVRAGMTTTFTSKFFEEYRTWVMDLFEEKMQDFELADSKKQFNAGIGKVFIDLSNQKLISFDIDSDKSSIAINDKQPYLVFKLEGIDLSFQTNFTLNSKPDWLSDSGLGKIDIKDLSIQLHLIPFAKDGKIQVDFSDSIVNITDYNAKFDGSTDFTKIFNIILKNFKTFFKNEVGNVLSMKIAKTFEQRLNELLFSNPSIFTVMENQVYLNYTLIGEPVFNKDYMTVSFDGTFMHEPTGDHQSVELQEIPSYYDQGKEIQIYISEQSLNSILQTLHQMGSLKLDQGEIMSQIVEMILNNFAVVFGKTSKARMIMEADESKPSLRITKDKTFIETDVRLHIKNPYNDQYDACIIYSKLEVELKLEVLSGFNLTGKVLNVTFTVHNMKAFFETKSTVEDIQDQIQVFVAPIQNSMNQKLKKGIKLPMPKLIQSDLSDSDLIQFDHFIMIQADPINKQDKTEVVQ